MIDDNRFALLVVIEGAAKGQAADGQNCRWPDPVTPLMAVVVVMLTRRRSVVAVMSRWGLEMPARTAFKAGVMAAFMPRAGAGLGSQAEAKEGGGTEGNGAFHGVPRGCTGYASIDSGTA